MSHQGTIQRDIMTLLLQLQASHSALERDNGRLVAENEILSTVLHAQTEQVKELLKTIQAQNIELEFHQRHQRQKL
jgi:hypothetical protein